MSRFPSEMPWGQGKTPPAIKYTPSPSDVAWAENLINMMKDGAVWGIPGNCTTYVVDKTKKQLRLVQGEIDDWFYKNIILFARIGYEVFDAREPPAHLMN